MKSFVLETKELLLSQGVIAILAIIQIRIVATNLGPEIYGKIGVYWGLIALCFRLLNSRNSDLVLINFKNNDKDFLRSSILFEIILGLISSSIALSLFLISINLEILDTNQIPFYIFIFIFSRVFLNILEVFKGFYTHFGNLKIYSLVESASNISRFVLVASFIIYNPQIDSFFFAISINNFIVGVVILLLLFKNNHSQNETMGLQEYYSYSKSNFKKIRLDQAHSMIILKKLRAKNLGSLISLYENKVFALSCILNINAFDQWGVEEGKKIANEYVKLIEKKQGTKRNKLLNEILKSTKN